MEILNLKEASKLLKMNHEVLRRKVKSGRIPGSKIGKRWLFIKSDLIEYVRSRQQKNGKHGQCQYTNAEISGGLDSQLQTDKEYSSLLGLKTG